MTTFLKTRNDKDNDYTELRETFEKYIGLIQK